MDNDIRALSRRQPPGNLTVEESKDAAILSPGRSIVTHVVPGCEGRESPRTCLYYIIGSMKLLKELQVAGRDGLMDSLRTRSHIMRRQLH
jgi:hypothetical protein